MIRIQDMITFCNANEHNFHYFDVNELAVIAEKMANYIGVFSVTSEDFLSECDKSELIYYCQDTSQQILRGYYI